MVSQNNALDREQNRNLPKPYNLISQNKSKGQQWHENQTKMHNRGGVLEGEVCCSFKLWEL